MADVVESVALALEPKCRAITGGANPLAMSVAREFAETAMAALNEHALSQAGAGGVVEQARAAVERLANVQMNISLEEWSKLSSAILAALAASAGEPVAWLDMASAPKDATEIILRLPCKGWPDHYSMIGHWAQDLSGEEQPPFQGWFWRHAHGFAQLSEPTGWRPLSSATPPSPVQTASVEAVAQIIAREMMQSRQHDNATRAEMAARAVLASLTAPTQGDGEPGEGMAEMGEIARIVGEWRHGPMLSPEALRQIAAVATPSSPVSSPSPAGGVREAFQQRVQPWMMACFGAEISADVVERNHRFLEEALELVQSTGCTASEAHQLVDYVFGREIGETHQEIGGVMVTLAALCLALGEDMHAAGETELARIWTKVEKIRAKQAAKPKHSPLPQHVPTLSSPATGEVVEAEPKSELGTCQRCGMEMSWSYDCPNRADPIDAISTRNCPDARAALNPAPGHGEGGL